MKESIPHYNEGNSLNSCIDNNFVDKLFYIII
jgi:hypothetical protein